MSVRPLHIPAFLLLGAAVAGCSSTGLAEDASAGSDATSPTSIDTGTQIVEPGPEITGYSLNGRLLLDAAGGDQADVEIVTYGADGVEVCREPLVASLAIVAPPEDEPVIAWWEVSLDTRASLCDVERDLFLHLGIGAWDERLEVSLAQQGLDGATAFGLYVQEAEASPVWVVGVAGTAPQLAGEEFADTLAPLADGTYEVASLVQAPWPTR